MPTPLLKVAYEEQIVLKNLLMRIVARKIHKPDRDIMPVIGNGFAIQQVQHPLQIGELVTPPAPVQTETPFVVLHQAINDNPLTEVAGIIGFIVPA